MWTTQAYRFLGTNGAITPLIQPPLMQPITNKLNIISAQTAFNVQLEEPNTPINQENCFRAFLTKAGNTRKQNAKSLKDRILSLRVRGRHMPKDTDTATSVEAYNQKNKRDSVKSEGTQTWRIFTKDPQNLPERERQASELNTDSIYISKERKRRPEQVDKLEKANDTISKEIFRRVRERTFNDKLDQLRSSIDVEILIFELADN